MKSSNISQVLLVLIVFIITLIFLFPVFWIFLTSLKPNIEIFKLPPNIFPKNPTLEAYIEILGNKNWLLHFRNSYFISFATAWICVVFATLAGYGFSRYKIRGSAYLLVTTLALQLFPGISKLIPYFDLFSRIGLYDTLTALIITNVTFTLPFTIWMMKSYIDSIPRDLEEAAMVDGATRLKALYMVVVPLIGPGVIAISVQSFLWAWNEYMFGLVLTRGPETAPVTVGIGSFFGQFVTNWNSIMAVAVLSSMPLLILFIFLQRYLIAGLTSGAVK
jgi:multiple sugar transport system permease protein